MKFEPWDALLLVSFHVGLEVVKVGGNFLFFAELHRELGPHHPIPLLLNLGGDTSHFTLSASRCDPI